MGTLPSWLNGPTALYRHFDGQGKLLYVGISGEPDQRLGQHKARSWWWRDYIDYVTVEWLETCDLARSAETQAIASESPLFNKTGSKHARAEREERKVAYIRARWAS